MALTAAGHGTAPRTHRHAIVRNWFHHLRVLLATLLPHDGWAQRFAALDANAPIPYNRVKKALREQYAKFVAVMAAVQVSSPGDKGVQRGVYFLQVASHEAGTLPKYMSVALSPDIVKDCMLGGTRLASAARDAAGCGV
jgi:hypothetical protein